MFINSIRRLSPFVVFLCLIVTSCVKDTVTEQELSKYVQEEQHGLKKTARVGSYNLSVTYRPSDLLVVQELAGRADTMLLASLRQKYEKNYYFVLSIQKNGKEALPENDNNKFSEVLQTISFRMGDHLIMLMDKDTIPLADYSFTRTFGMSTSTDLLLVFEKKKGDTNQVVQINLDEFGLNLGNHSFQFDVADLENIPRIKYW